jgi:mannose-1-phosphate guanylyltransferase
MKIVIFAGGSGRRLWPISRQKTPKQFEPIVGDRSTLQMAVDRVADLYGLENIYVSTNHQYLPIVSSQLPGIPAENLIGEPIRRDLAAAVGLAVAHLAQRADAGEPVSILWGDNTMKDVPLFQNVLQTGEALTSQGLARIVFMGETPRFANDNLGWLGMGRRLGNIGDRPYYQFQSLSYRPEPAECRRMFAGGDHCWNTGYFVTTVEYVQGAYRQHQPEMAAQLERIQSSIGTPAYQEILQNVYPRLRSISFDDAILVHLPARDGVVLHGEMGWSDPGTLYALKEALVPGLEDNATKGLVETLETQDSLLYNYVADKLLVAVGLDGMVVVNTEDAILVVPKEKVPLVKKAVDALVGTELEKYS